MNRRKFILTASGAAALAAGSIGYLWYRDRQFIRALATPQGYPLIWDEATVSSIGIAYRREVPAEADRDVLLGYLTKLTGNERKDLSALLLAVREEYAGRRTLVLNGWIVAETEARQCALFSLI